MTGVAGVCRAEDALALSVQDAQIRGALGVVTVPSGISRVEFHRRVVTWCTRLPFLPAPYGLALTSQRLAVLEGDEPRLLRSLADVEQRVEVVLTVAPAAGAHGGDGRHYLRARAEVEAARARVLDALRSLAAADEAKTLARKTAMGLDVSFLVSRDGLSRFLSGVRRAIAPLAPFDATTLTGPWPPYSFSRAWIRGYA